MSLQAARVLVKEVYLLCQTGKLARDIETKAQFKKAALSTMNNIAEGFGRINPQDVIQSSVLEVQSMTFVLEDLDYLPVEKIIFLREKTEETKALTLGLIKYLRKKVNG